MKFIKSLIPFIKLLVIVVIIGYLFTVVRGYNEEFRNSAITTSEMVEFETLYYHELNKYSVGVVVVQQK